MSAFRSRQVAAPLAALALVGIEAAATAAGWPREELAAAVLVIAPGLAVLPFLPSELRRLPVCVPAVPLAGVAVSIVMLVGAAAVGVPLSDVGVRSIVGALALACVVASARAAAAPSLPAERRAALTLVGLGAVVALGVALQSLVIGGTPLPGEDWGEYLLYAQEVERQQSLLIDNPFWMLGGESFPLDPGAPALYGSFLTLADVAPTALLHGIWLFAILATFAVFTFTAALWGGTAGLIAAGVVAVVPAGLNVLAWHGLPNVVAFALLPITLLVAGAALRGEGTRRWAAVLGVTVAALAATHRFSFVLTLLALAVCFGIALVRRPRETGRFLLWTTTACVVAGAGVAVDLVRRNVALGGTQGYEAFLPTKVDWELVARDLTWPVVGAGLAALVVVLVARPYRDDPGRLALLGLPVAILALTYAWVVHVPTGYNRAAFFAPLALAPALGLLGSRMRPMLALGAAAALVAVTALEARDLARDYRGFYAHVDAGSLRGLGLVNQRARPGDVLVTDQCWGFLATWLLQRPVLAALDPALILPRREVEPAERARLILYGPDGEDQARKAGARFALVDPQCTYQTGERYGTPRAGRLVYASTRLLVFDFA